MGYFSISEKWSFDFLCHFAGMQDGLFQGFHIFLDHQFKIFLFPHGATCQTPLLKKVIFSRMTQPPHLTRTLYLKTTPRTGAFHQELQRYILDIEVQV